MTLDYFYGQSGELFSYFRIPKALFQDHRFWQISTDARTLYGILLDRMEELENQIRQESVKKADTERFLALVKKYRDCHELTDAMLYSFIDRVEVHEATGGRTIYRKQNIDIYFNFIGNY